MLSRAVLIAAVAALGISGAPAIAATFNTHSYAQADGGKSPHSLRFSKRLGVDSNRLRGTRGGGQKKFKFEKSEGGTTGSFVTEGNSAKLTGTLVNGAGQSYSVEINFERVSNPGAHRNKKGVTTTDWSYYTITSGVLTSLSEGLESFDLYQRGKKRVGGKFKKLAAQVGTGANNANEEMMGLFTQFRAKQQDCKGSAEKCQRFNGNLKLLMDLVPPSEGPNEPGVVPLPASLLMLPAALGMLGVAGGVARRRRKS